MLRIFISVGALAALLAPNLVAPNSADAQVEVCVLSGFGGYMTGFMTGPTLESVEHGPFFSSSGELLTSDPEADTQPEPSLGWDPDDPILLCFGAYDPRCDSRDGTPSDPPQLQDARGESALVTAPRPAADRRSQGGAWHDYAADDAACGFHNRIERPPRR